MKRIFFNNFLLMLPIIAWLAAQVGKMLLHFLLNGKFTLERLVGAGGMPSSHSAMVCALFLGAARKYGFSSPYFAITLVLAAIVMYDAMGVRLETGKQAKIINVLMEDYNEDKENNSILDTDKKLKEMVGHTPLEVLSGAILGILVAIVIPVF
jgi:acid phosphatase family membrane protein YuiD